VLFGQYAGQKVKVNGEEVTILREEDILAIVD
jgi:co-chaperonin GroES (HSP10)